MTPNPIDKPPQLMNDDEKNERLMVLDFQVRTQRNYLELLAKMVESMIDEAAKNPHVNAMEILRARDVLKDIVRPLPDTAEGILEFMLVSIREMRMKERLQVWNNQQKTS